MLIKFSHVKTYEDLGYEIEFFWVNKNVKIVQEKKFGALGAAQK